MASNKRDQLLNTAENLFYREGYHATGIDRILAVLDADPALRALNQNIRQKKPSEG